MASTALPLLYHANLSTVPDIIYKWATQYNCNLYVLMFNVVEHLRNKLLAITYIIACINTGSITNFHFSLSCSLLIQNP